MSLFLRFVAPALRRQPQLAHSQMRAASSAKHEHSTAHGHEHGHEHEHGHDGHGHDEHGHDDHGHGEPEFNEPGGYLFGLKPGEKISEPWLLGSLVLWGGTAVFTLLMWKRKQAPTESFMEKQ